jgi:uncharacterized protein YqjF (DUF2071 family)
MRSILNQVAHRPRPLPRGPWIMAQTWHDLLFAHWPVPPADLRPLIPARLEIDTFDGHAWVAVVPFRMSGVRLRATPSMPWISAFPELNARTYVTIGGKSGVWFFSLDAANPVAVEIARAWFHLPYFWATMDFVERDHTIHYSSRRKRPGSHEAILRARYSPSGPAFSPKKASLEHFLTERYCLYTAGRCGSIVRGEIHHSPWQLQIAQAEFEENSMVEAAGVSLPKEKPLLHFAKRQDVLVWRPEYLPDPEKSDAHKP